jgi:hypothetical protein
MNAFIPVSFYLKLSANVTSGVFSKASFGGRKEEILNTLYLLHSDSVISACLLLALSVILLVVPDP